MTQWGRGGRMRAGLGVRLALAVVMTAVLLPGAAPAALGATDDNIPGAPIPASPFTGTLNETTDYDDVYSVYLKAGQSLTVALKGPDTADFDLYLYYPGATDVGTDSSVAGATYSGSVELMRYVAESSGTHYIDVYSYSGSGSYTLAWRVEDEIPGLSVYAIEGLGRIETAIAAAREVYGSEGSEYVLISTARDFPDALGGSALSGLLGAPVLLTEPTGLPASVATEIVDNLGATRVIILGGTGAVSTTVQTQLEALDGVISVERISGSNRYVTAENVAKRVLEELAALPEPPVEYTALIATGENFPDALAASSFASWGAFPFFLVHPGTNPAALATTLTDAGIDQVAILGGYGAVPLSIEEAIEDAGIVVADRFAGENRYDTAALLADTFAFNVGGVFSEVAVTTGLNFPDALAGGAALGQWGVPILLTRPTALEAPARDFLATWGTSISGLDFLGGLGSVNVPTRTAVRNVIRDAWTTGFSTLSVTPATTYAPHVPLPVGPADRGASAKPAR